MEPVLYAVTNVRQTQIVMVSLLYHALPARQTRIRLLAARHQRRAPATQATAGQQAGSVSAHDDGCWSFRRRLRSQKRHGDVCVDCPYNATAHHVHYPGADDYHCVGADHYHHNAGADDYHYAGADHYHQNARADNYHASEPTTTWSKVNPGSPLGQPWVPDFWGATVGPRRKLDYGGSR